MFKGSLKKQLSLTIAMVVLVTVAVISILSNFFIDKKFKDYIGSQQNQKTEEIVSSLCQQYNANTKEWNTDFIHTIGMYALYDGFIIKVYEPDGESVWDAEFHDMSLCTQVMTDISDRMQKKYPRINGEFTSKDYPLNQNDNHVGNVTISYYGPYFLSENDFQFLNTLNTILISTGIFSLVFSAIIGWLFAQKISRPIKKTVQTAKEISGGNYDIRIDGSTHIQELDALTSSVNQLAGSLNDQEGLRKRLTADVAHELRTPLTTVGTHLEAMIEGVWEPTTERLLSCQEEIMRITNVVKDLEQLARVEDANLKLDRSSVDVLDIINTISSNFETEIYKKNLSFFIDGESVVIHADKDRIGQVVLNLLSNAIKYSKLSGRIDISLEEDDNYVQIKIKDDGIGIPKEELPFIFERFYRADKSRNRKTGGAGIGLTIVKSIVQAHGGKIEVESETGQGTCFTVILPKLN